MPAPLYKKPLPLGSILKGNAAGKQDIGASISQYIELLIYTRFGEHRYMPDFGCEIWDMDFELIISESMWEEKLRQSLLRSVMKFERRLYEVQVAIHIKEVEKFYPLRNITEVKKQVEIVVSGKVQKTGENYRFSTLLYLSPLSA